jgi:hypothetical protein
MRTPLLETTGGFVDPVLDRTAGGSDGIADTYGMPS